MPLPAARRKKANNAKRSGVENDGWARESAAGGFPVSRLPKFKFLQEFTGNFAGWLNSVISKNNGIVPIAAGCGWRGKPLKGQF
jgi:hypothetical protein